MSADLLRRAAAQMRDEQRIGWGADVLLAVADLLEEVAAWEDEGLGHVPGIELTNYPDAVRDILAHALAVARAYLREPL